MERDRKSLKFVFISYNVIFIEVNRAMEKPNIFTGCTNRL